MTTIRAYSRSRQAPQPRWRRWLAWARERENQDTIVLAALGLLLGVAVVYRYGWGLPRVLQAVRGQSGKAAWEVAAQKKDPKVGQVFKLPAFVTPRGQVQLPHSRGLTGVVFIGNCSTCAFNSNMMAVELLARRFPQMKVYVAVMSTDAKQMQELWRTGVERQSPVVMDVKAQAGKLLNAIFDFRGYLFDPSGRLLYMTRKDQPFEEIERDVAGILQRGGGGQR